MCGIGGSFYRTHDLRVEDRIKHCMRLMAHRGPNSSGRESYNFHSGDVYFCHTRLAIIDLSSRADQPMESEDGRYSIVFNGEISNYLEIKTDLEQRGEVFKSQSDTEVLLKCWQAWGLDSIRKFEGMFAMAVLDRHEETITLVRDAFGIKPLYYSFSGESFHFASDIRAINALIPSDNKIDWQSAYDYLVHGEYDFHERTFFENISSLPPGQSLCVSLNLFPKVNREVWWNPSIEETTTLSFSEAADKLRELILGSVKFNLRSDVPVAVALSGGIDSSVVACGARYLDKHALINTYSYIADDSHINEEPWVDLVNEHISAVSNKVYASHSNLWEDLEDLIACQGEPFGSTSIYAQYKVFKLAHNNGISVTLDGQGADELMGGYLGYPGYRLRSLFDERLYADAWIFLNGWAKRTGRARMDALKRLVGASCATGFSRDLLMRLNGKNSAPSWVNEKTLRERGVSITYPDALGKSFQGRRMIAQLRDSVSRRGLPALLRHADRNSMRFSVESRVPFLTTEIAEFMFSLPEKFLVSSRGESKSVLRAAMRDIVPDQILDRKDKIGFATPEETWVRELSVKIRGWLSADVDIPFINQDKMLEMFDRVIAGKKEYSWDLWRCINFMIWYQNNY